MSDLGASDLTNQPLTPEAAAARHAELSHDPTYGAAAAAGDAVKIAELTKLWRVSRGMTPEPQPPMSPEQVRARMLDRDAELDDKRIDGYAKYIRGWGAEQRATVARGLGTQEQHDEAVRELERMKSDPTLRAKILEKDREALDEWSRWNLIAALRVAPPGYDWSK